MPQPLDTLVVGAGISGLTFAWARRRERPDTELLVLEAADRAGGLVCTVHEDGYRWERGPEALQSSGKPVRELCEELGVALEEPPGEAGKRYLESEGRLVEVPTSPGDIATTRLLPIGAKMRLMSEPMRAAGEALDGSIADFARHRLGEEVLARVVDPLVAGIHAGDPEQLSLRACFPEAVRMVEEHGSITAAMKARAKPRRFGDPSPKPGSGLVKPAGGMQALTDALATALGGRLRKGAAAQSLERTDVGWVVRTRDGEELTAREVVLALALQPTRELLRGPAPDAAAALDTMQAESLVSVVHAYPRAAVGHALDGFGYLVPARAGGLVLGTLFSSTIAPAAAPAGKVLLRSLVGGARNPDAHALTDDELVERVHSECAPLLDLGTRPELARVARWPGVIPRLDLEHLARREALAAALPEGLSVLGNFMRGIGIASLVGDARALAGAGADQPD